MSELIQHLLNGVALGAVYALIALGYTMVFGVLKLINFAHGDVFMVGAYFGYYMGNALGLNEHPSVGGAVLTTTVAMLGAAALGTTIERLAYRPLRKAPRINALITAIGVSMLLQYTGQIVFGADPKFYPQMLPSVDIALPLELVLSSVQLIVLVAAVALMVGLDFMVRRTKYGLALRALSQDFEAAALMGIPVNRTIAITFAVSAALAAAAGVLVGVSYPKIDPLMGNLNGMKAFVAAVLGGIGHIRGAAIGGLFLGLCEEMMTGYGSSTYRDAIAFVVLIIVLLVRPAGLFGKYEVEKV
ncbi:MAG: branched-chain amino acid ABC transporter permease [Deltaproteobacteria bacterium]|nr:branched-chain amino acid ABC transporter permease [Deltaproteobacteria bacterium]